MTTIQSTPTRIVLWLGCVLASCGPGSTRAVREYPNIDVLAPGTVLRTIREEGRCGWQVEVQTADGVRRSISSPEELGAYLRAITSPDDARRYLTFLSMYCGFDSVPKGERLGVMESPGMGYCSVAELRNWGVEEPRPDGDGFVLEHAFFRGETEGDAEVVRLRETVGRDGAYSAEIVEVLEAGDRAMFYAPIAACTDES